jgi:hypothetical protein
VTDAWMPTSQDVARWIARLTGSGNAGLAYDFTNETVPTADQVALIIEQASAEVAVSAGLAADSPYSSWARTIIALEAAAQTIISYDPSATEAATLLHSWYETALGRLLALARPGTSEGGSSQPIVGYVGPVGDLVWTMPPAPLDWPYGGWNWTYAQEVDADALWAWITHSPSMGYPPSFRNV